MSFSSMTGFAEAGGSHDGLHWRWEAKSVNGRGLDVRLRTPPGFDGLELAARKLASERFQRGSFQIALTVETPEETRGLCINTAALASAVKIARELEAQTGLGPARVDGLLALKGVIVSDDAASIDPDARARRDAALLENLAMTLDLLAGARQTEGTRLARLLGGQVDEIENLVGQAGALAATQPEALRARLTAQLGELLEGAPLAPDRLAQEAALLAVKADVREELDRLNAHIQDARALMGGAGAQGAVGRKLDFLAQEFNREANTLCSKSADITLTRLGLALKAVIDQFREQAQNVE